MSCGSDGSYLVITIGLTTIGLDENNGLVRSGLSVSVVQTKRTEQEVCSHGGQKQGRQAAVKLMIVSPEKLSTCI